MAVIEEEPLETNQVVPQQEQSETEEKEQCVLHESSWRRVSPSSNGNGGSGGGSIFFSPTRRTAMVMTVFLLLLLVAITAVVVSVSGGKWSHIIQVSSPPPPPQYSYKYAYTPSEGEKKLCSKASPDTNTTVPSPTPVGEKCRGMDCLDFFHALQHQSCWTTNTDTWNFSPVILTSVNDCLVAFEYDPNGYFYFEYPCYDDLIECWGNKDVPQYSLYWHPGPCPTSPPNGYKEEEQVMISVAQGRILGRRFQSESYINIFFSEESVRNVTHNAESRSSLSSSAASSSSSCWMFGCFYDGLTQTEQMCIDIAQQHIHVVSKREFLHAIQDMGNGD